MGDAGDAGAGSKIFVGGLDRTVDEGARDDARRRARRDDARDARARDAIDRSIAYRRRFAASRVRDLDARGD